MGGGRRQGVPVPPGPHPRRGGGVPGQELPGQVAREGLSGQVPREGISGQVAALAPSRANLEALPEFSTALSERARAPPGLRARCVLRPQTASRPRSCVCLQERATILSVTERGECAQRYSSGTLA